MTETKLCKCRLCLNYFSDEEMSEEHYPAKSVGNDDIVAVNIAQIMSEETHEEIAVRVKQGENAKDVADNIFDTKLSKSMYPRGRTARTLCRTCNTFLGKYDRAYLRFFEVDGCADKTKGFQRQTKYQIIKAIFAKFLSVPEANHEEFDFLDFIRDEKLEHYNGKWRLYLVKRDYTCDLFGMKSLDTGKETFNEGVVYEFSDDKFIFNLMNFEKHDSFPMTNIFEILNKHYTLIQGVGKTGGYHAQMLMAKLFSQMREQEG